MVNIIELLEQYTKENPNAAVLFDEAHAKGITYAQLDEISGRVYAYLSAQGVGREDFVLINLPRGVMPVIAMIGVWKTGAAWALVEDTYAPDRIDYIRRDCGCKYELNAENWEKMMAVEPKPRAIPRACCTSTAIWAGRSSPFASTAGTPLTARTDWRCSRP